MVTENSAVPDKSLLAQYLPANYTDAYSKEVSGRDETTPEELMQAIFTRPSPLAGALMKLRNILVKPFGLETGSLEKQVANRILCRSDREIVIGMNDKHLWFAVSLLCAPKNGGSQRITNTTAHWEKHTSFSSVRSTACSCADRWKNYNCRHRLIVTVQEAPVAKSEKQVFRRTANAGTDINIADAVKAHYQTHKKPHDMHKTTRLPWIATSLCLGLLLAGCGPQQQKNAAQNTDSPPIAATNTAGSTGDTPATAGTPAETAAAAQQMPGSDRDEHGCIGSAGYQWSQVQKKCIRIFEAGTRLVSATDPNATLAAYLVFGKDSLQSELFLPGSRESYLLNRRKTSDGHRWSAASDGTLTVGQADGKWNAERNGKAIYRQQ